MLMVAFAPALTAPPSQVTVGAAYTQLKRLVPDALPNATPAGRLSTTRTFAALAVPVLLTVSVYVKSERIATFAGPVFCTLRSGSGPPGPEPVTRVVALPDVLNVVADFVPVTVTVLLSVLPPGAFTSPRIVTVHT